MASGHRHHSLGAANQVRFATHEQSLGALLDKGAKGS